MKHITTDKAPPPLGPYTQATVYNGIVHVAMQLAVGADGTHYKDLPLSEQARMCLMNIKMILKAAGSDLDHCLKVTIFSTDLSQGPEVNRVYEEIFTAVSKPARSVVEVSALPLGFKVAVEAVGALKEQLL